MPYASYKGTDFRFGFKVLDISRERDLKAHKYPSLDGAEHEDLGEMPLVFSVAAIFPAGLSIVDGVRINASVDFERLDGLFREGSPGELILPGRGTFYCYFKKMQDVGRSGEKGRREIELEFVETLQEDLTISRSPDELEDMIQVDTEISQVEILVGETPLLETTKLPTAQTLYNAVLKFAQEARQAEQRLQQKIRDIQDAVERPYNEFRRLAAEIEQTANEATSLYRSVIQYADLPYTLAKRLKNIANILTSVGRRFLPPPVDSKGEILGEQIHGRTLTHRVVTGDTLQTISGQYYGSALLWECLAEANGIYDGNDLTIGDVLVLPDFGGRQPKKIEIKPGRVRIGQTSCNV